MERLDLLWWHLCIFGLVQMPYNVHLIVRTIIIVYCVYYFIYNILFSQLIGMNLTPSAELDNLMYVAYIYDAFHIFAIYLWSLRHLTGEPFAIFPDRHRRRFGYPSSSNDDFVDVRSAHIRRWDNVNFVIAISFSLCLIYAVSLFNDDTFKQFPDWHAVMMASEYANVVVLRILIMTVYAGVSSRLGQAAETIDRCLRPDCSTKHAANRCQQVVANCAALNHNISYFLKMVHFEYFIRLVCDLGVHVANTECDSALFFLLINFSQFHLLVILANRGDAVVRSTRKLRNKVRHRLLEPLPTAVDRQLRYFVSIKDVGVNVGGDTSFDWRSTCRFIGASLTFTFIVFQIAMESSLHNGQRGNFSC